MKAALPTGLQASLFGARQRLHIQHGPTDLVIDADGPDRLILFEAALNAMHDVLSGLAEELPLLRAPWDAQDPPSGPVAMRMHAACSVAGDRFVTPMAAVAGAIADHVLSAMLTHPHAATSSKISVNNGGDIAFWTSVGAVTRAAIAGSQGGGLVLQGPTEWNGLATSGQGGRSLSPGIADSVTVLGNCAATADVAATLIAGAVDCPGAVGIKRIPAYDLDSDSDLGNRLVTVAVPQLGPAQIDSALATGGDLAKHIMNGGQIAGAVLELQGRISVIGLDNPAVALVNAQDFNDRTMNEED